jgi:hypothetical protein
MSTEMRMRGGSDKPVVKEPVTQEDGTANGTPSSEQSVGRGQCEGCDNKVDAPELDDKTVRSAPMTELKVCSVFI